MSAALICAAQLRSVSSRSGLPSAASARNRRLPPAVPAARQALIADSSGAVSSAPCAFSIAAPALQVRETDLRLAGLEDVLRDPLQYLRHPGVEIARISAFDHDRETVAGDSARDVAGLQERAQQRSEFVHDVFGGEGSEFTVQRRELVGLEAYDGAQAGLQHLCRLGGGLLA